jgi:hypothetical protein
VVSGNVITCEGRISAVDAAFALVERLAGSAAVEPIRTTLLRQGEPLLVAPRWYDHLAERFLGRPTLRRPRRRAHEPAGPPTQPPVTPLSVMIELVEDEATVRRLKRAERRRHNR